MGKAYIELAIIEMGRRDSGQMLVSPTSNKVARCYDCEDT